MVKYSNMIIGCVFLILIIPTCMVTIMYKNNQEKLYKNYYDKKYKNININKIMLKIITNKLNSYPKINYKIDKKYFYSINLRLFPTYVVDKNKLGENYLKIYKNAIESLKININFVVLNGKVSIKNKNINCVCLDKQRLDFGQEYILNLLNVNKKITNNKQTDIDTETLTFERNGDNYYGDIKNGHVYALGLPTPYYNYLIWGKKNKTKIMNIFGEEIASIFGFYDVVYVGKDIFIEATKNTKIKLISRCSEDDIQKMSLLSLNISADKINKNMAKLKSKAIDLINKNPFALKWDMSTIKCENIDNFFKLSFMRKNYLNDYVFLLKNIFGVKIENGVLFVKPQKMIDFDFSIRYIQNGDEYEVKYSNDYNSTTRLDCVGHKLGHRDNYVLGF